MSREYLLWLSYTEASKATGNMRCLARGRQVRWSRLHALKTEVTVEGQVDMLRKIESTPHWERKRCPGGAFDGLGEVLDRQTADGEGSMVIEHWHKPAPLVGRITLRMYDDGSTWFEDRPNARLLQMPQVDDYFSEAVTARDGTGESSIVLDCGANIGVFACTVLDRSQSAPRIYSIEPIPFTCNVLRMNLERYPVSTRPRVITCGVSNEPGFLEFEMRRGSSHTASCRSEDGLSAAEAASVIMRDASMAPLKRGDIDKLFRSQSKETVQCEVRTLSEIISAHRLPYVSLLKLDVEGSEHLALQGITDEHFATIKSVIIEVHNVDRRLEWVLGLLHSKGLVHQKVKRTVVGTEKLVLVWASREAW
eukprot:TRINITY_DN18023_c0_g1_i1.p1 TRINITY_DN18023_c0_g1~~TRINITY_DN18023_c0_g1_i1.p1  ORF type:complete len:365 (+),score=86.91 TRINITY_DN18023_c0_g1_i1:665-1759(+)